MEAHEKFRQDVEYHIERAATDLALEDVVQTAKAAYRQFHSEDRAFKRDAKTYALAAIYLAGRYEGYPITQEEVSEMSDEQDKSVVRAYRKMADDLGMKSPPPDVMDFIDRFGEELELDSDVVDKAKQVYKDTADLMNDKARNSAAASSIYLASRLLGKGLRQDDISEVADVSNVTIRNRYQEQEQALKADA